MKPRSLLNVENYERNKKRYLMYKELFSSPYSNSIDKATYSKQVYEFSYLDPHYLKKSIEKILDFDTNIVVQNEKRKIYGDRLEEYLVYRLPIKEINKNIIYGDLVLRYCTANKSMEAEYTIQEIPKRKINKKKLESDELYVLDDTNTIIFPLLGTENATRLKSSLYLINHVINRFLNMISDRVSLNEVVAHLKKYVTKYHCMFDFRYHKFLTSKCESLFNVIRDEMDQYHNEYLPSLDNMYKDVNHFQKHGNKYYLSNIWHVFQKEPIKKNNILLVLSQKLEGCDQLNKYYEFDHDINIMIHETSLECCSAHRKNNLMNIKFNISIQNNQARGVEGGLIENYITITEKDIPIINEFGNEYSFQKPYEKTFRFTVSQWKTKQFVLGFMYERLIQVLRMPLSCGFEPKDTVKDIIYPEARDVYSINIPHDREFILHINAMEKLIHMRIPANCEYIDEYFKELWAHFEQFKANLDKRKRGGLVLDNKKFKIKNPRIRKDLNDIFYIRWSKTRKSPELHIYLRISLSQLLKDEDIRNVDPNILKDIKGEYTVDMSIANYSDAFLSMVNIIRDVLKYRDRKDYLKNIKFNLRYNHINDWEPYTSINQSYTFIEYMTEDPNEIEAIPDY